MIQRAEVIEMVDQKVSYFPARKLTKFGVVFSSIRFDIRQSLPNMAANETLNRSMSGFTGEVEIKRQAKKMLKYAEKKFPDSPMPLLLRGVQTVLDGK